MVAVKRWTETAVYPRSAEAARFAARMVESHLAARFPGRRVGATVAGAVFAAGRTAVPGRWRPEDQAVFDGVAARWPHLLAGARRRSALVVERSAARTMFVFGDAGHPVVVAKTPRGGAARIEAEEAALTRAREAAMAPAPLGWVAGAFVQEGLPGHPPEVPGVPAPDVPRLPVPHALADLGDALVRLAATSAASAPPDERAALDIVLDDVSLAQAVRTPARAAVETVRAGVRRSVLRHGDLSPQNWLLDRGRFTGVVDWETAVPAGVPGFDALHAAVTWFESAVERGGGDEEAVAAGFDMAWSSAPLFEGARQAAATAADAADVRGGAGTAEALVVAFFVRRLARRVQRDAPARDVRVARRMLDAVARG